MTAGTLALDAAVELRAPELGWAKPTTDPVPPNTDPVVLTSPLVVTPAQAKNVTSFTYRTQTVGSKLVELTTSIRRDTNDDGIPDLPDTGDLDTPHHPGYVLAGSQTIADSVAIAEPGKYVAFPSYKDETGWHKLLPAVRFTVAPGSTVPTPTDPTPVPPSTPTGNPFGTTGARSGLNWNSGIWPLARSGSGASYTSALGYSEAGRGRKSDLNMSAQYVTSWPDLVGLQVLGWLLEYAGPVAILMLPPFPPGGSWTEAAAGKYDAYYKQIGAQIAALAGNRKVVLRFAWEANGDWYHWSIVKTGGAAAFIGGWRKAVDAMRSGAGAKAASIIIDYSISGLDNKGQGDPLTATYPGDAWVDVIGEDSYDDWQVTTSATVPAKVDALNRIYDFAVAHGKWMSIDEWGLHNTGTSNPEGRDNPKFISAMMIWIKAHRARLAWEQYFQDDAQNNVNNSFFSKDKLVVPLGKAEYLKDLVPA